MIKNRAFQPQKYEFDLPNKTSVSMPLWILGNRCPLVDHHFVAPCMVSEVLRVETTPASLYLDAAAANSCQRRRA